MGVATHARSLIRYGMAEKVLGLILLLILISIIHLEYLKIKRCCSNLKAALDYRKSSNYSAKKNNSNLRVALILERTKLR